MDQSQDWTTRNIWDNEHVHHHEQSSFKKPLLCLKGSKLFSDPGYIRDLEVASDFKKTAWQPFPRLFWGAGSATLRYSPITAVPTREDWILEQKVAQFSPDNDPGLHSLEQKLRRAVGFVWFWKTKELKVVSGMSASGFRGAFCVLPSWLQPACGVWLPSMERALPKNRSALRTFTVIYHIY